MKHSLKKKLGLISSLLLSTTIGSTIYAAAPVVNTTITLEKTGSEPFDATTWDGTAPTAGTDQDVDNNIVRMQDSVTYRVEVSVNDASVDNLVSTVLLPDGKQKWIEIPTGCKTDPTEVTPISAISADGYTLTCNIGAAIEGTTKVIFPAAKVVSYNEVTNLPVVNAEHTVARTTATATGANTASAGDTDVIITAGFKLDTTKTMKVAGLHPTNGSPLYTALSRTDVTGTRSGILLEYRIAIKYENGSMLMDSGEAVNGYLANINLIDHFTDDNTANNGALSTGGKLYTWGPDGAAGGCYLEGDHGATAAVNCAQNNNPVTDSISPSIPGTGVADGLNDPNIDIALTNIDVRDPDGDSNVVDMIIAIWFDKTDELLSHQSCAGGSCQNYVVNSVGVNNNGTFEGFNPVSTEDAGGLNLTNYNGAGEAYPNEIDFPLVSVANGAFSAYKLFEGFWHPTGNDWWTPDEEYSPGQMIQYGVLISDHRADIGGRGQHCDMIDTTQFTFSGLHDSNTSNTMKEENYFGNANLASFGNPFLRLYGGGYTGQERFNLPSQSTVLYTDVPVSNTTTPETVWLPALQQGTCGDDVDGDGQVRIKLKDGSIVDATIGGAAVADGGPIDWYEATGLSTAGIDAAMSPVTRIRTETRLDQDLYDQMVPAHTSTQTSVVFDVQIKPTATGYGAGKFLPNYAATRRSLPDGTLNGWYYNTASTDVNDVAFSKLRYRADRVALKSSSISIAKRTEPKGIKVVRGGDLVDFVIEPKVIGLWGAVTTATVTDALPPETTYVLGSEMFSIDGGATWLNYTDFNAVADVTITSPESTGPTALTWAFDSVDSGNDQLPLIKYTVDIDATVTSGDFLNTAVLDSAIDDDGGNSPVTAKYSISVFPEYGLDLVKRNQFDVYQTNEAFEMELIYKNLGGENYGASRFIDILPHNADGAGNSSGLGSSRIPPTTQTGTYEVTKLTGTNGETYMATVANPATIPQDVCHEDNLGNGIVPSVGDLCYNYYISSNTAGVPTKTANTLAGGGAAGTGAITWTACTGLNPVVCGALDPADITAIRIDVPTLPKAAGGKIVKIELTPTGNLGGTPDINANGDVTAVSTGDIYTNTFGGRVPEISLLVISNDVSVTMVSGSIGDYVWMDQNGDGVQDAGEAPLVGVTLKLLDNTGNPIYVDSVTGGIVPSSAPNAIAYTATTDGTGNYSFDNLPAGDYKVEMDTANLPANLVQTFDNDGVGTPNISSVTLSPVVDPISGVVTGVEDNVEQDFGYKQLASLGNLVWDDANHDGIQNNGEAGVDGVTVNLLDSNGNQVATTTTAGGGNYMFNDLAPGSYSVEYVLPTDFVFTGQNQGNNDALDSDVHTGTGKTGTVVLAAGDNNTTLDAGLFKPASLGNLVWDDANHDGIQNNGEVGVDGVTVNLLDSSGNQVATTTTANGGNYVFNDLTPGSYSVEYVLLTDFEFTSKDQGNDDALDSDVDEITGKTDSVTITAGDNNTALDAGVFKRASLGDSVWNDTNKDGVQDAGESGIGGVTANLLDGSGVPILDASNNPIITTTASDGSYTFDNLIPGTYSVSFDLPAGFEFTTPDQGDDTKDSDADVATGKTDNVILVSGENNTSLDAGLSALSKSIEVVKTVYGSDEIVNGVPVAHDAGASCATATDQIIVVDDDKDKKVPVTYCFEVTNTGETYLTDISLEDTTIEGVTGISFVPNLLSGTTPLAPGASLFYYYEVTLDKSLDNTATAKGKPSSSDGTVIDPAANPIESTNPSEAKVALIIDPPSSVKTVTPSGVAGMEWKMVWINDSTVDAQDVKIFDIVPVGTTFEAMPAGANISVDGVFCEARGASVTTKCEYDSVLNRVVWEGSIASDAGLRTEDTANNEVVIRFISTLDDPNVLGQSIENQATSEWDYDNDGNIDNNIPSQAPNGDPNTIFSNTPETIPTLSEWALLMLMMMLGFVGFRQAKARGGVRF